MDVNHPAPPPDPGPAGSWWATHRIKVFGGVAVLVTVGLAIACCWGGFGHLRRGLFPAPAAYPTVTHPSGDYATSEVSPATPVEVFAGTPAQSFPAGAAGITLPQAKPTGDFTAKQVADALAKVRAALVVGRLDRSFMSGRNPAPFVRQFARDAQPGMRKDFTSDVFASYATFLAPQARLTADEIRVKGRVTYRAAKDRDGIRVVEIITNFVWVYPFLTTDTTPGAGLVVVHDTVTWQVPHPDDVESSSKGLWMTESESYGSNIDCAQFDKGLLALGQTTVGGVPDNEDPDAVFDPDRSLDIPDTC